MLDDTNGELLRRIEALELEQDRAHQYSRRNSVRISGIPEKKDESTDQIVLSISESIGAYLNIDEIDRSHRVGRHSDTLASNKNRVTS